MPAEPSPPPPSGEVPYVEVPSGEVPYVEVAVPLPFAEPLVYAVPEWLAEPPPPGVRVRVPVGSRRVVGVVVGHRAAPPAGVAIKPLEAVMDREPALPPDLLALASFTADYYLAPLGEVLRGMLPGKLPPWGDRRVWLTDRGALALPRDEAEREVLEALRSGARLRLGELAARLAVEDLQGVVERLRADGWIAASDGARRGARYVTAYELAAGSVEELAERAGRSRPGRAVVAHLAGLGRPATIAELTGAVGCGEGVVRRLAGLGVLRSFTQVERLSLERHRMAEPERPEFRLRPDQRRAVERLEAALATGDYGAFVLDGVTGSGKTEVYLRAAARAVEEGRGAILLVPEIALVPALAATVRQRFGSRVAMLHSALGSAERTQEWDRIRQGEARVVLGPRSAVFAPVARLGLVVVDEEQDGAYKQDERPRYNGRDLALVRARAADAVAVLVSATPSLETRHNVERGKMSALTLTARVGRGLPEGIVVDLRQEGVGRKPGEVYFSKRLREELERALAAGDQAILMRNRRGYAPVLLCRACGEDMRCDDCGLPRTLHKRGARLQCHYCGSRLPVPERCPACGKTVLEAIGAGTERVEERFADLFPGVAVEVLDRDTVRQPGGVAPVLERFSRGESQVLIGTQMVSKGHHFPGVALTGMLLADTYLGFPDFRAVERTYTLLTQLAGRSGRGDRPGRMVIQTYHPGHYAVRAALEHDDAAFAGPEMRFRRIFHYPPFTRMVQLLVRDADRERGQARIGELAAAVRAHPLAHGLRLSGPAPAPFERLKGRWRFQLLLRGPSGSRLKELLRDVLPATSSPELVVDVDPYELL